MSLSTQMNLLFMKRKSFSKKNIVQLLNQTYDGTCTYLQYYQYPTGHLLHGNFRDQVKFIIWHFVSFRKLFEEFTAFRVVAATGLLSRIREF